jgi:transposase
MKLIPPEWVLKQKKKNIEIRKLKGNYYAYSMKSIWDKEKKRAKKVTGPYLGKITPDGLIPAKHKREKKISSILEYGNVKVATFFSKKIETLLRKYFPYSYQTILAAATIRLLYKAPLKNNSFFYNTSYLKKIYPSATMSSQSLSASVKKLGIDYGSQISFFRELGEGKKHVALDLTHIFSSSKNINWLEIGHNNHEIFKPQVHLLLMYSMDQEEPIFWKMLPGSIADVSSLTNSILESRLKNVVIVSDKGFYSEKNIGHVEDADLSYIMPIKRNLSFLCYFKEEELKDHFCFRERIIWYTEYLWGDRRIIYFLDKKLKVEEENNYLYLVKAKKKTKKSYNSHKQGFGTISIVTNSKLQPEEVYHLLKNRIDVEQAFDTFKNTLESDKTYMRNEEAMRGYFFISFLALYLHCKIMSHLRKRKMLEKVSVNDVLVHLAKIYKVQIDEKEITSEIPKKTRSILEGLNLPIT